MQTVSTSGTFGFHNVDGALDHRGGHRRSHRGGSPHVDRATPLRSHGRVDPNPQYNPYQPPATRDDARPVAPSDDRQASRGSRLLASFVDSLIIMAIVFPLQFAFGVFDHFPNIEPRTSWQGIAWSGFSFLCWFAIHGYFLKTRAQTIGKRMADIQIVNFDDDRPARLAQIVVWRHLPISLVAIVPYVGIWLTFVDCLFIFRSDHRCLHDHVARTRVVRWAPPARS